MEPTTRESQSEFVKEREAFLRKVRPMLSSEGYQNCVLGLYAAENVTFQTRWDVTADNRGKVKIVRK